MAGPSYHGRTHLPGGTDPIPGLTLGDAAPDPFYDAVAALAATRGLIGYWRLGEGGLGPYADTSGYVGGPMDMARVATGTAMTDLATGALPTADDDGAVQFNNSTGAASDYLEGTLGTSAGHAWEQDLGTIAGWVKPFASGSAFKGGIVSLYGTGVSNDSGWSLGVEWPTRRIFHLRGNQTYLYGPVLEADEWVFATGIKDSTSTRLYLNGALVASGAAVSGASPFNAKPVIGKWSGSSAQVLYGAVDEVSVWTNALTDAEIATLAASGGVATSEPASVIATSGAYTAAIGDDVILATGTFTVTLPTAVGNAGVSITIKNTGVGTITVGRTSSQTIDGAASDKTISTTKAALEFTSDGTGWQITKAYL